MEQKHICRLSMGEQHLLWVALAAQYGSGDQENGLLTQQVAMPSILFSPPSKYCDALSPAMGSSHTIPPKLFMKKKLKRILLRVCCNL